MLVTYAPLRADDAYIVARYATQWWRGHGLVYNVGERIGMFTSPLHAGLAVALGAFAADVVAAYQMLAAIVVASLLCIAAWLRWHIRPQGLLFLALTLASPIVAFWTVGGLETPLLLVACTAIALLSATDAQPSPLRAVAVIALCGVAVFTRYDAILFCAPVALAWLWPFRRDATVVAAAIACVLLLAAWIAWTVYYYGDALPTSFYVKASSFTARDAALGLLYLASFFLLSLAWVPLAFRAARRHSTLGTALALGLALELAYGIFAGTRHMMYLYRLFVPYLPAFVLLLMPPERQPIRRGYTLVLACVALQGAFAWFIYSYSENPTLALAWRDGETFEFERLGARHTATFLDAVQAQAAPIAQHWQQHGQGTRAPRVVVSTGGMLPYMLPDAYVLEMLASYRHRCRPELAAMADYHQVVYAAQDRADVENRRVASGQTLVSRQTVVAGGVLDSPLELLLEIWHEPNPSPLTLPRAIGEACGQR